VQLLLHGHTHDGRPHRLGSGLITVSTGSAAVSAEARPAEVPNQYQLLTIDRSGFTRYARQYALGQKRWIGDTRVSRTGSTWHERAEHAFADVDAVFPTAPAAEPDRSPPAQTHPDGEDLLFRVVEATRVMYPQATVTPRPDASYLRIANPLPDGIGVELWPVGVIDGDPTATTVDAFAAQVHARFASADPTTRSQLVYGGRSADDELVRRAGAGGVWLRSLVDYQGLLDLRPLVARQAERLATDRVYPPGLYVPQRYRPIGPGVEDGVRADVAGQIAQWLTSATARMVLVLGDFGRGKTSLLRHLARTLPQTRPDLLPVLVELRSLEKAPSLDELLAQHLIRHGVQDINPTKLRYMIYSGRLALLFDGFDELELRVGYDNAADYLRVLLASVTDRAKVVLTSRTQHFQSTDQVRTALGDQIASRAATRIVVLEDFAPEQIAEFLTKLYAGDGAAAQARMDLMADIEDLPGLARNPRMLAFIAALHEDRLRAHPARARARQRR
jgi:NACHT-associated inactive Restriction Endonuclease 2/NACHT domain